MPGMESFSIIVRDPQLTALCPQTAADLPEMHMLAVAGKRHQSFDG
jgi:hypothetical protein